MGILPSGLPTLQFFLALLVSGMRAELRSSSFPPPQPHLLACLLSCCGCESWGTCLLCLLALSYTLLHAKRCHGPVVAACARVASGIFGGCCQAAISSCHSSAAECRLSSSTVPELAAMGVLLILDLHAVFVWLVSPPDFCWVWVLGPQLGRERSWLGSASGWRLVDQTPETYFKFDFRVLLHGFCLHSPGLHLSCKQFKMFINSFLSLFCISTVWNNENMLYLVIN